MLALIIVKKQWVKILQLLQYKTLQLRLFHHAPTVDFNIVDIYNKNIGSEAELCSDATEIVTTSEECLRQYRNNLETVFSFDESLYTYITELNTYLESYPSAMTEEYIVLFEFLNNQYLDVPETYGLVLDKYNMWKL